MIVKLVVHNLKNCRIKSRLLSALFVSTLLLLSNVVLAQSQQMDSQQFVLNALLLENASINGDVHFLLMKKPWEAIAYIDSAAANSVLKEAVPDEYTFDKDKLTIVLSSSQEGSSRNEQDLNYCLESNSIVIYKDSKALNLVWQIIYLDSDYLVLDIDGLRLFLIHP